MCGLFGFDGFGTFGRKTVQREPIRHYAELAARRGPHTTGVAWVDEHRRVSVRRWAEPWEKVAHIVLPELIGARAVIGICRLATSTDWRDEVSGQPMQHGGTLALVHNGVVPNHMQRAQALGLPLKTRCDSEALSAFVFHARSSGDGLASRLDSALRAVLDVTDLKAVTADKPPSPREPYAVMALEPDELAVAVRGLPLFYRDGYYCSLDAPGMMSVGG